MSSLTEASTSNALRPNLDNSLTSMIPMRFALQYSIASHNTGRLSTETPACLYIIGIGQCEHECCFLVLAFCNLVAALISAQDRVSKSLSFSIPFTPTLFFPCSSSRSSPFHKKAERKPLRDKLQFTLLSLHILDEPQLSLIDRPTK